jgi:hypothetical protein
VSLLNVLFSQQIFARSDNYHEGHGDGSLNTADLERQEPWQMNGHSSATENTMWKAAVGHERDYVGGVYSAGHIFLRIRRKP